MTKNEDALIKEIKIQLRQMKNTRRKRLIKRFVSGKGIQYFNYALIAVCLFILMTAYDVPIVQSAIIVGSLSIFNFLEGLYR